MADPLTITATISGLIPLVGENLALLRDAFVEERALHSHLGRVELQKTIFQAWYECWTDSEGRLDQRMSDFAAASPLLARGVLQQLVLFLRTVSDAEKLQRKYGLTLKVAASHRDDPGLDMGYVSGYIYNIDHKYSSSRLQYFDEDRRKHLALLQRVRFTPSHVKSELEDLLGRLDELNRNLQLFSPQTISGSIDSKIFELAVKGVGKDLERTRRFEEAAAYEAKHSIDEGAKAKYGDISKLANFSMAIEAANADMSRKKIFRNDDLSFDTPYFIDKNTTLARLFDYPVKHQSRLVLVEWVTAPRDTPSTILKTQDETKVTWFILHAEKPERLLLPATIGLIIDESSPQIIGLVFQLPQHIRGNLPTKPVFSRLGQPSGLVVRSPKAIAAERMPTSLRQVILKRDPKGIDLGIRFKLAQKLLNAVHLMHIARFTHRNIRPDNILLFPAPQKNGSPDPSTLDYTAPLLFGFHDAPLETQLPSPTADVYTQPEGLKPILKKRNPGPTVIIDCYSHPERRLRGGADKPFRKQHDLYALGCVLLELGLWETLDGVCGREIAGRAPLVGEILLLEAGEGSGGDEERVWKDVEVVRRAAKGLDVITGSVYAEVTRMCLSLSFVSGDIIEMERRVAAMLAQIAA